MVAPFSVWPWENMGSYKYVLYGPLVAKALHSWVYEGGERYGWCLHILIICALRGFVHQLWSTFSNMLFLTRNRLVIKQGVDFKQIDKEWDWDNFLILHAFMAAMACSTFPFLGNLPVWNWRGAVFALLLHIGVSEPLYYWIHRKLHVGHLFTNYHSLHHSAVVPQPFTAQNDQAPDFVFLAHAVDVISSLHLPYVLRSFTSLPFRPRLFLLLLWPGAFVAMLIVWASSKTFLIHFYTLRGRLHQTWTVPRYGFQYFLPFATNGINYQIEQAILRANRMGVKVISLAALNKNEALNGGGTLFVKKHPNLKVRVVHGNTLTAAVILNEIGEDVKEVFLTGATSKLGRAIALYLCRKKMIVMMLTVSIERFQAIQREAPVEFQQYLVHVTKYQDAGDCKTWIVGKWLSPMEQRWAVPGTHFLQFVVPPIFPFRRDCTYGKLAAMRLPDDVQGLGCCEASYVNTHY